MPLPSPPLPSLSAITHPTKVRWLLQEEERESGGGDHSAKYNADEREGEGGKCTEWAAAKPRKEGSNRGKRSGTFTMQRRRFHEGTSRASPKSMSFILLDLTPQR